MAKTVLLEALKTGVLVLVSLVIALPLVDPVKFSLHSLGGWGHIIEIVVIVILVVEVRYRLEEWARSQKENAPKT
ncbi:MAG TPA: hypothetical protein VH187_07920 [Scandinavium sp.]|jgi:hypothetical protein|uniref:hypothetical protein n=1 Tax=Scandinavium sp. TaxID=2830653 RepID=UPI002E360AB5|nr:hypothetical protein [Scandinavium sp.]HEX4501071.1 hypothetical protein [Scandinavium sp.]